MALSISTPHRDARSLATIAFADEGVGGSFIPFRYTQVP
ncbi:hypothetical protein H4V98_002677 [Polaromonas sp. CG_23.6]|nr:hypothetical protein [Polaromonas sp. CG_23.6]